MKNLQHLFDNNVAWAEKIKANDPGFFDRLSEQQTPDYLWIGCSDSRVPATQIVNLPPGEVFVHRNIANVVVHNDTNCLSVIQFAVEVLKVKHIIVCGHYGCGGVKAAVEDQDHGLINEWLAHIKEVKQKHLAELADLTADQKNNRMCELNVIEQVKHVSETAAVQNAWKNGNALSIHGWIYDISDGILHDLDATLPAN
ncbi:MAG: carbonate dehydratase [Cellvibrionales bacterium]|nr:carbonate dehydratase [Cellvibrionales bacterium]MBT6578829.1 carbonate dehydratase [Cellvibrionales bacterium]MDA8977656.1 carbonate dehydratase [bacterium]